MEGKIQVPLKNPSYDKLYAFEIFDFPYWRSWMGRNWTLAVHISFAYLIGILFLEFWMRKRRPFDLKIPLIVWNAIMAVFSIGGFMRTFPEMKFLLTSVPNGFYLSICSREHFSMASSFWCLAGTWAKVADLGDTFFIVLRKRRLIFLHWYHHLTVMVYTWATFESQDSAHRWFVCMNYFVHSLMYSYYTLKACSFRVPTFVSICITSVQIAQMIIGICINVYAVSYKWNGGICERKNLHMFFALGMYVSYMCLFAQFFYKTYVVKKKTA